MIKIIDVDLEGYYLCDYNFPTNCGIYCIYTTKQHSSGKYIIDKLVYIGRSENLKSRIQTHGSYDYPIDGNFAYSFCELTNYQSKLVEAALINECQPKGNSNFIIDYPDDYESVCINVSGKHLYIPSRIYKGIQ